MTFPASRSSRPIVAQITQVMKTIHAKVALTPLPLKHNARVPEVWIDDGQSHQAKVYPLLGDRYVLGRSQRSCDIVIDNPVISHIHAAIERDPNHPRRFVLEDQGSTNGIFRRKRRIQVHAFRHRDHLTLGPAELEAAVQIRYIDPPPPGTYGRCGTGSMVWQGSPPW